MKQIIRLITLMLCLILFNSCQQEKENYVSWEISGAMYNGNYILEAKASEIPGKAIGMHIPSYDSVAAKTVVTFEDRAQNWIFSLNIPSDSTEITLEKEGQHNLIFTDTELKRSLYPRGLKITVLKDSSENANIVKDKSLLDLFLRFEGEMFLRDSAGTEQIHQVKGELKFFQPVIDKE